MKSLFISIGLVAVLFLSITESLRAQRSTTTTTANISLAPSWYGNWDDFSIETTGDFVIEKVRYKWIGSRSRNPKKAGCWAFYDGVTSKADWILSFKRAKTDPESKRNLAGLNDERFKLVSVTCTDRKGREIDEGADCIHSGYFKDDDVIYEPITCQIGNEFEIELRKIMRK